MARKHVGSAVLVVDSKLVHHRGAGLVQADHLHFSTFAPELDDHLVQRTDGSDVPEVGTADVDAYLVDDLFVIEGVDETLYDAKNTWPVMV